MVRNKQILSLFIPFALGLALAGCANPKYVTGGGDPGAQKGGAGAECMARFASGACVSLTWEQRPTDGAFGSFLFKIFRPNLADGSAVPVDPATGQVAVLLWMPGMGHGSAPVKVSRIDVGTFRADNVFFTMKGDWEIHVQLKEGDVVQDEAVIPMAL
jgi:hypothetical protein